MFVDVAWLDARVVHHLSGRVPKAACAFGPKLHCGSMWRRWARLAHRRAARSWNATTCRSGWQPWYWRPSAARPLPAPDELGGVLEALTPGLRSVFVGHGTKVYQWPSQLSPRGFGRSLFAEAPLPGDHGRGTPWCALAGRVDSRTVP